MPGYKSPWDADRALSNAKFESYKLRFDEDDDDRVRLIRFAADAALPGRTLKPETEYRLGYREARNRAKWNHLACGPGSQVAWMDSEGVFWLIDMTEAANASPRQIVKLPEPVEAVASSSALPAEYPVVRYLGKDDLWVATDGLGRLYVVSTTSETIQVSYELLDPDTNRLLSSRMHAVRQTQAGWQLLLSAQAPNAIQGKNYRLILAELPYLASNDTADLRIILNIYGPDLPSFCVFDQDKCCIGSTSLYSVSLEVQSDQANDAKTAQDESVEVEKSQLSPSARPSLNWMQDRETVTLTFVLPSGTRTKDIKVTLRAQDISILVTATPENKHTSFPLPRLLQARIWDHIDASSSTWTWEAVPSSAVGTLMLHLEKRNEGTRWPYLFSQDKLDMLPDGYADISETQDRSELLKQIEALQKFTSEDPSSNATEEIRQRGSLLGDEFDEDIDHAGMLEGRNTVFTWLSDLDTGSPRADVDKRAEATEVLSVDLPSSATRQPSIIIKHDVDGLLFALPNTANAPWSQQSTCPAINFILASKRDVGQVYHCADRLCIGLETGISIVAQRAQTLKGSSAKNNVYCYYPPAPGSKDKLAPQKLFSLLEPSNGAVLGAVAVERRNDAVDLVVLCERALAVIEGIL